MPKRPRRIEFGDIWGDGDTPDQIQERWGNQWVAWSYWVFVLEDAARVIGEQSQHQTDRDGHVVMPAIFAVRAMLLGYAIECAMKCYWVKLGNQMVENGKFVGVKGAGADHNLCQLGKIVGYQPTERESEVLERLSKFIRFAGRYPISKRPDDMAPRDIEGLGKLDVGYFSKADFRTCLSILNKLMSKISGKKRHTFHPIGTVPYYVRAERAALRKKLKQSAQNADKKASS